MAGAQKPICIITSTGMVCLASPMKRHHPGAKACVLVDPDPTRSDQMAELRTALKAGSLKLPKAKRELVAKVVELLLAAKVGSTTPFVVVRA